MAGHVAHRTIRFGHFRLDQSTGELCRIEADGPVRIGIGRRAFDVLCVLLEAPGSLVTKQELLDAVWPGVIVEENNLTVQISALRRALDEPGAERSCIQTTPGRGYRFVLPVSASEPAVAEAFGPAPAAPSVPAITRRGSLRWTIGAIAALAGVSGGVAAIRWGPGFLGAGVTPSPPRLSLAVLPFEAEVGDAELRRFADIVTETLTTDLPNPYSLAYFDQFRLAPPAEVTAQLRTQPDTRALGAALGVRYVLSGHVRRLGEKLQLSVELVATETGTLLWTDVYEDPLTTALADPRVIARWVRPAMAYKLIDVEAERSLRERPNNPDEMDLILEAKSWQHQQPSPHQIAKSRELYERALRLDPGSVNAMSGLGFVLLASLRSSGQPAQGGFRRIEELVSAAEAIRPNNPEVLWDRAHLLLMLGRWPEARAASERLYDAYPIFNGIEHMLGYRYLVLGRTDSAIEMFQRSIRKDPPQWAKWGGYHALAMALLLAGRYDEAVDWEQRALAASPGNSPMLLSLQRSSIASAHAGAGRLDEARAGVEQARRAWRFMTARSYWLYAYPSAAFAAQVERVEDGLRLAGLRDHADEDADAGVAPQAGLRDDLIAPTPLTVPGARTVRTADLASALEGRRPLILDTAGRGRSVPGVIALLGAGAGGTLADDLQGRMRDKMDGLTHGAQATPLVTLDYNAERWGGYNLALRLVALGYSDVSWYRGGQESWQASGHPVADIRVQDW